MEVYSDEENREWARRLDKIVLDAERQWTRDLDKRLSMSSHSENIARLELVIDLVQAAHASNERGDRNDVSKCLLRIDEIVRRTINTAPFNSLTEREAIGVRA